MTHETRVVELLERIDSRQERMITALLGDLDHEHPRARIPLLESGQADNLDRITKLEHTSTRIMTLSGFVALMLSVLSHMFWPRH